MGAAVDMGPRRNNRAPGKNKKRIPSLEMRQIEPSQCLPKIYFEHYMSLDLPLSKDLIPTGAFSSHEDVPSISEEPVLSPGATHPQTTGSRPEVK